MTRPAHLQPPNYVVKNVGGKETFVLPASDIQAILDENCRLIVELTEMPVDSKNPGKYPFFIDYYKETFC